MTLSPDLIAELEEVAQAMADAAARVTLAHFRSRDLVSSNKEEAGFDPVTIADRDAEAAMLEVLSTQRPQDAVLGEEHGSKAGTSGLTWVLDPIDGTRGFISGTPTWGTLIAVGDSTGPAVGIIDQPFTGERFIGTPLSARTVNRFGAAALACSSRATLDAATIFTTFPEVGTAVEGRAFHAVASRCLLTRYGMDCYAYALLAAGHVDLVIEAGLNSYDIQAPIAVVQAAGGIVTDWDGGPAHNGGRAIAAANGVIHAAALDILSGFAEQLKD